MTHGFRTGMHCKMLCTRCSFHGLSISLESFYKCNTQAAGQIRIFSVSLMSASPSWITKNIYIGRPQGQSLVNVSVSLLGNSVVFCTGFGGNGICDFTNQIGVESCTKTNCLRKYSCLSSSCDSVKSFIPPVVCRNAQTLNGRCIVF